MSKLVTRSGRIVDLDYPKPEQFSIHDVAWALAHEIRWNGCLGQLSVAQHSISVMRLLADEPPIVRLFGLLHDVHEALIGDVANPVKLALRALDKGAVETVDDLTIIETRLQVVMEERFVGRVKDKNERKIVSAADLLCARVEASRLGAAHWKDAIREVAPSFLNHPVPPHDIYEECRIWPVDSAAMMFLEAYGQLKAEMLDGGRSL